jgi:hypothetical protein
MAESRDLETHVEWPRMPNGLPYKETGETFGHYWARLTEGEAVVLAVAAKRAGLLPQAVFNHYVTVLGAGVPEATGKRVAFSEWQRADLLDHHGRRCGVCGDEAGPFHIDHRDPLSRGGTNDDRNLWVLCAPCNLSKGNQTVDEFLARREARETTHG